MTLRVTSKLVIVTGDVLLDILTITAVENAHLDILELAVGKYVAAIA